MKTLSDFIIESKTLKYSFNIKTTEKSKEILSLIKKVWDDVDVICKDEKDSVYMGCENMGNMIKLVAFLRCYLSKTENPLTMDGNVEDMNDITYYIGKENFGCVNVFSSKMEDEIKNVKAKLK